MKKEDIETMNEEALDPEVEEALKEGEENRKKKRVSPIAKYTAYIIIILLLTAGSLALTLYNNFFDVVNAFTSTDWRWILVIAAIVFFHFLVDAFIIFCYARLYTRRYKFRQAMANKLVGMFYDGVLPAGTGEQVFQTRTLSKQGVPVSNAASIMVMSFITYQIVLILYGLLSFIFKYDLISSIGSFNLNGVPIPVWPLAIFGFIINISLIGLLFLMSYNRHIHNFIMKHSINLLAKMHLLKHPEKTRESLRIQVENFKIELRRLQSNIPFLFLIIVCSFIMMTAKYCIPYFAGMALDGLNNTEINSFFDACFMSSFHQMCTGFWPLPGTAGISEIFFSVMFYNDLNPGAGFYTTQAVTNASLIIWRFSIYTVPLLFAGLFTAFYRATPSEMDTDKSSIRQTYLELQLRTFEERRLSSNKQYETSQLSRRALQEKLHLRRRRTPPDNIEDEDSLIINFQDDAYYLDTRKDKIKEVKKASKEDSFTEIDIDNKL